MADNSPGCCGGPDPARCPLCGKENQCALARGCPSTPCWCADVAIAAAVLASIPAEARGKACICRDCALAAANSFRSRDIGPP
jgi:Cysteine-rich CWC